MDDQLHTDLCEVAAHSLAQGNLMVAMLGVMKNRGLITQADINEICDLALVGAENMADVRPDVHAEMRQSLESFGRIMGGKP